MNRRSSFLSGWAVWALAFGLLISAGVIWMLVVQPGRAQASLAQATAATASLDTTVVERGELILEASGTGTLVAKDSSDLTFAVDGQLESLNVQVGDKVTAGQILAQVADIQMLSVAVDAAEIQLKTTQMALEELLSGKDAALAQALEDLSQAQASYADAQAGLRTRGVGRCEKSVTENYWRAYFNAGNEAVFWEEEQANPSTGYGKDFILEHLRPIYERRDQAYINWKYCEGYTEEEVLASEAALQLAAAKRDLAQQRYDQLLAQTGITPEASALAQANMQNAAAQLENAKAELAGATLTAPIDGTVMEVNAKVGSAVKAGSVVITISDLTQTILETHMDESDLLNFSVGCSAEVIFDSISDRVFNGTVTAVLPVLATSFGSSSVDGYISMDTTQLNPLKNLPVNLTGSVDITCETGDNVLLVPVTSLVNQAGGGYAVLVVNSGGQIETRSIEIGRRAALEVEVLSGLTEGERVVTLPESTTLTDV